MTYGITATDTARRIGFGERRVVDAVAKVPQRGGGSTREEGDADAVPGQRRGCGTWAFHGDDRDGVGQRIMVSCLFPCCGANEACRNWYVLLREETEDPKRI